MPRQVDHARRRRQIAEAVWRLAGRGGLEEVTLRQVAAEADVSVRLVQYYFGTRDDLLLGALEIINADAGERARERVEAQGPGLREIVRAVLLELLPLDEERRARHVVYAAYFVRFLADAGLRAAIQDDPDALETMVAALLADVTESPGDEAAFLVAAAGGLQGQILLGHRTEADAVRLIDRQLDRVFRV
ncbi:TetR/AcrR family transcriptional regulator [Herbidospora cretacea]|uniref:TetR/AcrR family transcriptional regulator n=1 Tax=Herbidospora cretacea TaxID=28444 RepID=UPI000773AE06|nr:TetR/AcrR family transcriptional regulator [Herbidospora cretacea]